MEGEARRVKKSLNAEDSERLALPSSAAPLPASTATTGFTPSQLNDLLGVLSNHGLLRGSTFNLAPGSFLATDGGTNEGITTAVNDVSSDKSVKPAKAKSPTTPSVKASRGGVNEGVKLLDGEGYLESDGAGSKNKNIQIGRESAPAPEEKTGKISTTVKVALIGGAVTIICAFISGYFLLRSKEIEADTKSLATAPSVVDAGVSKKGKTIPVVAPPGKKSAVQAPSDSQTK